MPTGYTEGIIKGEIQNFEQFAKKCMRAFGATIHMRDESLDAEYEPRTPSDYYVASLERAKRNVAELDQLPDSHFIDNEIFETKNEIVRLTNKIEEIKKSRERLESILSDVEAWTPPGEDHTNFKDFMLQQLTDTIDRDCDIEYYERELEKYYRKLESPIDVELVKDELRNSYEYDVERCQKNLDEEIARCKSSNDWVETLLKSI